MPRVDYSFSGFQNVVEDLIAIAGDCDNPVHTVTAPSDQLVEVIRCVAETLLWGEQNEEDTLMFDYFCEKGVMKIFVALLNSPSLLQATPGMFSSGPNPVIGGRQIKVQLLQTMSLLVLNIKRQTSLYFLFSNNAINQLINNNSNLDFSDEEILSYYVTFMKSIALRLSSETVKLFINEKSNYFPLFIQSIRFFDHHDRMIRTAVRTITLSVFKLYPTSQGLRRTVLENSGGYFSLLACQLRDLWFLIERSVLDDNSSHVGVVIEELIDQLEYIADIARLDCGDLTSLLLEKIEIYAVDPVLLPVLTGEVASPHSEVDPAALNSSSPISSSAGKISYRTAVFVLCQLLHVWKLNPLTLRVLERTFSSNQDRIRARLKEVTADLPHLVLLFSELVKLGDGNLENVPGWISFGLTPPESIELSLLVCQAVAKALDRFSPSSIRIVMHFLTHHLLVLPDEFQRPLKLTLADSFKHVSQKISQKIADTVALGSPTRTTNEIDHSVIDLVERVIRSTVTVEWVSDEEKERLARDPKLFSPNLDPKPFEAELEMFVETLRLVKRVLHPEIPFDLKNVLTELFDDPTDFEMAKINSPALELIETESLATDRLKNSDDAPLGEGSLIDLGRRERIVCTHISAGRSTRYLVLDPSRLVLVAPDLIRPGFGVVKYLTELRRFQAIKIDKDDQRILRLTTPVGEELLGFEDLKRCHLALMQLETKRTEIRRAVYTKLDKYIKQFNHYI